MDEVIEAMAEMLVSPREYLNISGNQYDRAYVREKIESYNLTLMEYLLTSMNGQLGRIRNVKKYMMACIMNAPNTFHYSMYTQAKYDLYHL